MIIRFFRSFFWAILISSVLASIYLGSVAASAEEAILVEDRYHGIRGEIIGPGEYEFLPERIIPGQIKLHRVNLRPHLIPIKFRAGLSQSRQLGLDDSFYIKINFQVNYVLKQKGLLRLYERLEKRNRAGFELYLSKHVKSLLRKRYYDFYSTDSDIPALKSRLQEYFDSSFISELNEEDKLNGMYVNQIIIEELYVPDFNRYKTIIAAGEKIISRKIERLRIIDEAMVRKDSRKIRDEAYYARLETIGKLLDKYPQLRGYLAIDRLSKNVEVLVVPAGDWFGKNGFGRNGLGKIKEHLQPKKSDNRDQQNEEELESEEKNEFRDLTPP